MHTQIPEEGDFHCKNSFIYRNEERGCLSFLKSTAISLVYLTEIVKPATCVSPPRVYLDLLLVIGPTIGSVVCKLDCVTAGLSHQALEHQHSGKQGRLYAQPCRVPVLWLMEKDIVLCILTVCVDLTSRENSFCTRSCGMIVWKTEVKSKGSRQVHHFCWLVEGCVDH